MAAVSMALARHPADLFEAGLLARANESTEYLARTTVMAAISVDCGPCQVFC